jgi:alpha-1,2-mannosyltransferase
MTVPMIFPAARDAGAEVFFKLALALGIVVAGLEIGYLLYSPLPYDPVGYYIGRDFVNTWLGAQLALTGDPGAYFGLSAYNTLLAEKFGGSYPLHIWSYAPPLLLFTWPLAFLPYMVAYVLYCAIGLALYVAVVSEGDRRADHLLLLVLAPAVVVNIWCGQNGFLIAALLVGGLVQLDRRPVFAGVLFGLLSIKPQLGLLLPLMLALTGRWRTIAAAAATIVVLVAAAGIVFGPGVWIAYVNEAMPVQSRVFLREFEHFMVHMPTAFMNARIAGFSLATATWVQALLSAVTVAAVTWTFWRRRDRDLSNVLFVTAAFVVTPYVFNYDMVVFGWVILKLLKRTDNDGWDYGLMLAVWAVPFLTVPIGMAGIPISCLPAAALGARLVWRIWNSERRGVVSETGPITIATMAPAGNA